MPQRLSREEREPPQQVAEQAQAPASAPRLAGAMTPDRMLALQRTAGNAQVARILGIGEPKLSDRELVDKALGPGGTANDAKDIQDFRVAKEDEKAGSWTGS